jgi:hypothetical protein
VGVSRFFYAINHFCPPTLEHKRFNLLIDNIIFSSGIFVQ